MGKLNICFITQKYDESDPYRSNVVEWIRELSLNKKVNNIHIITRKKSSKNRIKKGTISSIDSKSKIKSLILFYIEIFKQLPKKPIIFIHMGGPYAINLFLFKLFFRLKIYQWWAHPKISHVTRIGFYVTLDKLFTCSENSFPINSKKKIVLGHGINIKRFPLRKGNKSRTNFLVTASRLTSRKNIDKMIYLTKYLNDINNKKVFLKIYGSPLSKYDLKYKNRLIRLINKLKLNKLVEILPAVDHRKLHLIYKDKNIYLNFSNTAVDKAILEAMSTGIPVLSCNPCLKEIIDNHEFRDLIMFNQNDSIREIANKANIFFKQTEDQYKEYKLKSHNIIKSNHTIKNLMSKIVDHIDQEY